MGKLLSLGPRLKYPITITKLIKKPGDDIQKQEKILEYKFKWTKKVGDPLKGEEWDEEQTTFADWDCPVEGKILKWKVEEGMVIERDTKFVEVEELCPHSIQYQGLCGICGKDMTEISWASTSDDTSRASINMIHDQTALKVSQDEASRAEEELQRRLLQHRKLSLVVDLDQTIIHACIDPTVGVWQNDPTSPNHEVVKDVRAFQLNDDGPRGLASGCWYYIKMRPGLEEFLAKVSEMYELHVYTMGTRAYANNIAKIVDPDKKLFGDRIISRDENGNITTKSLARLFPVDTKMVVIIDDRSDVWPKNRPNLIKVVPYDFFLGIGDINSSFLPKREELPKQVPALKKKQSKSDLKEAGPEATVETPEGELPKAEEASTTSEKAKEAPVEDSTKVSALEELVRMGGGDDQGLRLEQAAEQEKSLEKQLTERPLAALQEKLDKEDEESDDTTVTEEVNGEASPPHPHHRHNLLKDDDVELKYLERHLSDLHKSFYEEYDGALINAQGGRVAQLKPGHKKKLPIKDESADLKIVPDIGDVMTSLKARTFAGCTMVLSGLVPLQTDLLRTEIGMQASSFGATLQTKVNKKVTHLITPTNKTRTMKVRQAAKYPQIKVVHQGWLLNSMSKWEREDEEPYLVEIHEADRVREEGFNSGTPSTHESDDSSDDDGQGGSDDEDNDTVPVSQEEPDDDGVMPSDIEGGNSPIEGLNDEEFWKETDRELAEFLGGDSGDDSDASTSSRKSGVSSGRKRKHDETTDEDDSDEESALAKKQRIANSRTTGLKTSIKPLEGGLPTPGVTGDEEGGLAGDDEGDNDDDDDGDDDGGFGDELEADLLAEFEAQEAEDQEVEAG